MAENLEDSGLNPLSLNPATDSHRISPLATLGSTLASSSLPASSTVFNSHPPNQDAQENKAEDASPSSESANSQRDEASSESRSGWQLASGSAKKKSKSLLSDVVDDER